MHTAKHPLFCFIGLFLFHLSEPGRRNNETAPIVNVEVILCFYRLQSETLNGLNEFSFSKYVIFILHS